VIRRRSESDAAGSGPGDGPAPAAGPLRRAATLAGLGAAGAGFVGLVLVLPNLWGLTPRAVRDHPGEWAAFAGLAAFAAVGRWGGDRDRARVARVDDAAGRLLDGWAAPAIGLGCLALLASWAPQYLTWPWSRDTEAFAVLAQSWDAGIRPYRDILAYNFPGETYYHWILGKLGGWGRTVAVHGADVALVGLLGVALVAWSRRRFGSAVPGLVAYLAFLHDYLGYLYDIVAQRDWHATLGVVLALLVAQAWPGRGGRLVSAMAAALALAVRPQVVLFLPALAAAVDPGGSASPRDRLRAVAGWALAFGASSALAFAPVFLSGMGGDFLRGLRLAAYGGPYNKATPSSVLATFLGQFREGRTAAGLALAVVAATTGPAGLRRVARPWALGLVGALLYAPISPVQHDYLRHAAVLLRSVALATPAARLLALGNLDRTVRLVVLALMVRAVMPEAPRFCLPAESLKALGTLARGEEAARTPRGAEGAFYDYPEGSDDRPGDWRVRVRVLDYLRTRTSPGTLVANVLNRYPFEPINGPTGRISPFRCESGICWMMWVAVDLDGEFAEALGSATDAVVVWEPDQARVDPRMTLPRTVAAIRRDYRPEARFGPIEVWRKVGGPPAPAP